MTGNRDIGVTRYDGKNIYGYGNVRLAPHYVMHLINPLFPFSSLLDIGCGDGIVKDYLPEKERGEVDYIGIDIGAGIYEETKSPNIKYVRDHQKLLNSINDTYDVSILINVLEHTLDFTSLFKMALEKTKMYILVTLPNAENIHERLRFLLGKGIKTHMLDMIGLHPNHRHLWLIQIEKAVRILESIAKNYEFQLINITHYLAFPTTPWKRMIYRSVVYPLPWSVKARSFAMLFEKI